MASCDHFAPSLGLESSSADLFDSLPATSEPLLAVYGSFVTDCRSSSDVSLSTTDTDATQLASAGIIPYAPEHLSLQPFEEAKRQRVSIEVSSSPEGGRGVRVRLKKVKHGPPSDTSLFCDVSEASSVRPSSAPAPQPPDDPPSYML